MIPWILEAFDIHKIYLDLDNSVDLFMIKAVDALLAQ